MDAAPDDRSVPRSLVLSQTIKTHIKAGGLSNNHSQTLVQAPRPAPGLTVKTYVKAGGVINHNETLAHDAAKSMKAPQA
jgi:hypothetical protein